MQTNIKTKIRCAIYTRKSCEEGLDMEYNSLDNQRDSCEKYISSQEGEGWISIPKRYDDGGYSGGNLERPALKELLMDISLGLIDMVVVYKIDRLSRSLMDFSKLVDVFNSNKTSFISVTQNFNTNDSMGKLMLNILLSFAQFEREMTGDRIRDKVRMQKSKGMWTGGKVPLGYSIEDKKLIINENESKLVKFIFESFNLTKSIDKVLKLLKENGYKNKTYISKTGNVFEGHSFNRGTLYKVLNNKTYIGLIENKKTNEIFQGQHKAIIDSSLFEATQSILKSNLNCKIYEVKEINSKRVYMPKKDSKMPYLLRGLMRCECCNSILTPLFTVKKRSGLVYRYYKPNKAIKHSTDCKINNISAPQIENLVLNQIYSLLKTPTIVAKIINQISEIKSKKEANPLKENNIQLNESDIINYLKNIETVWDELFPKEQIEIVNILINKIIVGENYIRIFFNNNGVFKLITESANFNLSNTSINTSNNSNTDQSTFEITIPVNFRLKAGRTFITTPEGKDITFKNAETKQVNSQNSNDLTLITTLIQAEDWKQELETNKLLQISTIADRENKSNSYICKILNLIFLAPDIKRSILTNNMPLGTSLLDLYRIAPMSWLEQRAQIKSL